MKIFLNYFLGPLLFIWFSISIYRTITHKTDWINSWRDIKNSFYGPQAWKAVMVICLMLLNWSIEALKWKVLIKHIQPITFFTAFRAVVSGVCFSLAINTPNGIGEYLGRILYINEGNRIRAITLSFVGSISQLIITMVCGTIGLILLRHYLSSATIHGFHLSLNWIRVIIACCSCTAIALIFLYFRLSWLIKLLEKIPFVNKYAFFIQKLEEFEWKELLKVISLSLMRYSVFVVQYLLLLQVFDVQLTTWFACWLVTIMFLALAIVPTIALAELGLRGRLSILLFGLFSTNTLGILFTASGIWFINLVVPALAGSLFILGIKIFKKSR